VIHLIDRFAGLRRIGIDEISDGHVVAVSPLMLRSPRRAVDGSSWPTSG
jgi:hypothetical protein